MYIRNRRVFANTVIEELHLGLFYRKYSYIIRYLPKRIQDPFRFWKRSKGAGR